LAAIFEMMDHKMAIEFWKKLMEHDLSDRSVLGELAKAFEKKRDHKEVIEI